MDTGRPGTFRRFEKADIEQSIGQRFDRQVLEYGDRRAVRTRRHTWTYRQLAQFANKVASNIIEHVGADSEPTALLLDQGAPLVAAILGVLKANKFYVPLDPLHPLDGLTRMVVDSRARLVITDQNNFRLAIDLAGKSCQVLLYEELSRGEHTENPGLPIDHDSLAYIFYTSGSTGRPKGVMDTHRNVLHNIMRYTNNLHISADDRLTLLQFCSFSGSVSSLFGALLNGACSLPFDLHVESPDQLAEYLLQEKITIYHSVPAIFRSFLRQNCIFPDVRVVRLEGDLASKIDAELFRQHFDPDCILANGLGATETGLVRQYFLKDSMPLPQGRVPVGYPVEDMEILLFDEQRQIPANEIGEIAVRSEYLSPGYWQDPERTNAAFLLDLDGGNKRTYRTGDLGRMRGDGCLELLGRKDFRVKIRGNTVEVAEVESALLALPEIKHAVVVADENHRAELRLVAYLVAASDAKPSARSMRRQLTKSLPPFMIPSNFVFLDELPLTENRKIDRSALPTPRTESPYLPPRNPVEIRLVAIWEEVLGVRPIGIKDNFIERGGDSLLAVQLMLRIEQSFGKNFPAPALLAAETVEELAATVQTQGHDFSSPSIKIQPRGSGKPFFYIHGDYQGVGLHCVRLARYLGQDRPFYALQPVGPQDESLPATIQVIAASYLRTLRTIEPHGPYLLGGFCNGGIIAFEIAQQLRDVGETVDFLLVVDSLARNTTHRIQHKLVSLAARALRLDPATELHCFLRLRSTLDRFNDLSGSERIIFVFKLLPLLKNAARLLPGIFGFKLAKTSRLPDNGNSSGSTVKDRHYTRLLAGYVPYPYRGRVTLFHTSNPATSADPAQAWRDISPDVDVHLIPGDHSTCVDDPNNLEVLAQFLKSCLKNL